MAILGIIPARGGSKGIPNKNITLLAGKPLLAFTCSAAVESKKLTRVCLNTDDPEIAAIGKKFGVDAPFLRPPELAQDEMRIYEYDEDKICFVWGHMPVFAVPSPEGLVFIVPAEYSIGGLSVKHPLACFKMEGI